MRKYYIGGATGDTTNYDNDANWQPFSLRNSSLAWTASGSGTNEYYLRTSGGANPATGDLSGLVEPANVYENGVAMAAGTAGSLAAGAWDWADNDTLGYSTIYVRLSTSGATDPDAQATNFITATDTPNANDDVFIGPKVSSGTAVSHNISSGLDQSGVEIDDFVVLPTYTGKIGLSTEPLSIDMGDADLFRFEGRGTAHIDVNDAAISPDIIRTATASNGASGLYLSGSAIAVATVEGGSVEFNAATVTTLEARGGATVTVREDSTVTTANNRGTYTCNGNGVTLNNNGGTATINGGDAYTTVECTGGTVYYNSTGTLTTARAVNTGIIDLTRNNQAKTVTNLAVEGTGQVVYSPDVVTVTNAPTSDGVVTVKGGSR